MADKAFPAGQGQLRAKGAQLPRLHGLGHEKPGYCVWKARSVPVPCDGSTKNESSNHQSQAPLLGACPFIGPPQLDRNHRCARLC